jgi:2-polyprenyl-6-methoxyphenol hydroxylase-like FAD-dependent oxidoreductase
VIERAPRFDPLGAGIVLQPNAVRALRIGGIEEPVLRGGASMERMQIRDANGRILSSVAAAAFRSGFGAGVFGFHRATLHEALLALAPANSLRLGAAVRVCGETADGVFVELESGERIEGRALIGADGLRSAIRRHVAGAGEPRYSGYTSWRGVLPKGGLWPAGQMSESWGRGARFGLVAIDSDRLYWFATANAAPGGRDTGKDELRRLFSAWHRPIREVIESTPESAIIRTDIADRDPLNRWSQGRVTLLGDAAHPMTPNLGQGGGQAIEDAVVLDLCLSAHEDVAAALEEYQVRRIDRTTRVVMEARKFGRLAQMENGAARLLRNLAVRLTPSAVLLRSLRWLYDFDV